MSEEKKRTSIVRVYPEHKKDIERFYNEVLCNPNEDVVFIPTRTWEQQQQWKEKHGKSSRKLKYDCMGDEICVTIETKYTYVSEKIVDAFVDAITSSEPFRFVRLVRPKEEIKSKI